MNVGRSTVDYQRLHQPRIFKRFDIRKVPQRVEPKMLQEGVGSG